jgi:hypothetical protein
METAKVDVRKLQLLNDRINQCLDALNQVRLSTHGLSHTPANVPFGPFGAVGAGSPSGGYDPRFAYGMPPTAQGFGGGLSHTPFAAPLGAGFTPGIAGVGNPISAANQFPIWSSPIGLSHTGIESESLYNRPLWADPVLAMRVAQTFPYVQFGLPPVVSIY